MRVCPANWGGPGICSQINTRPGSESGGADCGPCATVQALYIASCGRHNIGSKARRTGLIEDIRRIGGAPPSGATTNRQNLRAYVSQHFADEFAALGLRPPRASREFWREDFDSVFPKPQLQDGKWVSLSIMYSVINDDAPVTGDPLFRGPHQVNIGNLRTIGGVPWVTFVDPLMDGRRAGIAQGPVAMRLSIVKDAADAYTGDGAAGTASGWAFWTVSLLHPEPDPDGTTTVPNIVNDPEATALSDIAAAELVAGNREEGYHASIAAGNVISQDPASAATVNKGTEVDYVVSLGPAPAPPSVDPEPPDPCGPAGPGCGCG